MRNECDNDDDFIDITRLSVAHDDDDDDDDDADPLSVCVRSGMLILLNHERGGTHRSFSRTQFCRFSSQYVTCTLKTAQQSTASSLKVARTVYIMRSPHSTSAVDCRRFYNVPCPVAQCIIATTAHALQEVLSGHVTGSTCYKA